VRHYSRGNAGVLTLRRRSRPWFRPRRIQSSGTDERYSSEIFTTLNGDISNRPGSQTDGRSDSLIISSVQTLDFRQHLFAEGGGISARFRYDLFRGELRLFETFTTTLSSLPKFPDMNQTSQQVRIT
jgi:hypothetical protein